MTDMVAHPMAVLNILKITPPWVITFGFSFFSSTSRIATAVPRPAGPEPIEKSKSVRRGKSPLGPLPPARLAGQPR